LAVFDKLHDGVPCDLLNLMKCRNELVVGTQISSLQMQEM